MKSNAEIQRALLALGQSLGPTGADGVWAGNSRKAIEAFQKANSLPVSGFPDARSLAVLFPGTVAPAVEPLWHVEAKRLMGTREIVGRLAFRRHHGLGQAAEARLADDKTPWCGLFVAHCSGATLPAEPLPANPLGARNWLKFGRPFGAPALGAVLVFN